MALPYKAVPLVAPGHTRPVTHLSFSPLQDDGTFVLISSCKDGNPMLREWTGDWIGTFIGHKGAVWSSKLSPDTSRAASGSADFTAYVSSSTFSPSICTRSWRVCSLGLVPEPTSFRIANSGTRTPASVSNRSRTITSFEASPSPRVHPTCSLAGKRRRSGCSISTDRTPSPTFSSTAPALCRTTGQSRA